MQGGFERKMNGLVRANRVHTVFLTCVLGATGVDRYIERHIVMYAFEVRRIDEFRWYRRKNILSYLFRTGFLF